MGVLGIDRVKCQAENAGDRRGEWGEPIRNAGGRRVL